MSSHFARLKEELDAQKKALAAKAAEVNARQNEVKAMQHRLEALETMELAMNDAMHSKSGTQDVIQQVIERAIHSDHMTGSEVVQKILNTAIAVNGRTRNDNLGDFLMDLIVDEGSLEAAIEAAMENVNDAVKHILAALIGHGVGPVHLNECIKKIMGAMADEKPAVVDSWGHAKENQGWYRRHFLTYCALSSSQCYVQSRPR